MSMIGRTILWRWRAQSGLAGTAVGAEGGHGIGSLSRRGLPPISKQIIIGLPTAIVLVGMALFLCRHYPAALAGRQLLGFLAAVVASALIGGIFPTLLAVGLSVLFLERYVPWPVGGRPGVSVILDIVALVAAGGLTLGLDRRRLRAASSSHCCSF